MRIAWALVIFVSGCAAGGLPITGAADAGASRDGGVHDFAVADLAAPRDMTIRPDLAMPITAAPCLTGGSVVYLDGDPGEILHPGAETMAVSAWTPTGIGADTFSYDANLGTPNTWGFSLSSEKLGQALAVGYYDNAMSYPFEAAGHPGIEIDVDGGACGDQTGWFQIESIAGGPNNGTFTELTATFGQSCSGETAVLHGCIHFEQ